MGSINNGNGLASSLTLADIADLLKGHDFWHTCENQALGFGALRFSDGPNGVRGEDWVNGAPSSAIPCATALGASFDEDLVFRAAQHLADECNKKGIHALLAPTMNIHRYPLCGRNFESFSEDPYLTGVLATAYVKGLQDSDIAACPKHFLANEAENDRRWSDSVIEERALREIYLEPFRMVVKNGDPWTLMTAYNSLNGSFCSESESLLAILRHEWHFDGVILSDWFGTYSSIPALKAGLDLEMPGPSKFRHEYILERAIADNKITRKELEASAARVVKLLSKTGRVGMKGSVPPTKEAETEYLESQATREFLREAARASMVLLKNERQTLPLPAASSSRLAVFGDHARNPALFGGGSASLKTPDTPTPWDEIRGCFPAAVYSKGVGVERLVKTPRAGALDIGPITLQWYNGRDPDNSQACFFSETLSDTMYMLVEDVPKGLIDRSNFCTTMTFSLVPPASAEYRLSVTGPGSTRCTLDGDVVLEVRRNLGVSTEDYLFDRSKLEVVIEKPLYLKAGVRYDFLVTSWSSKHKAENVNREFFIQGCRVGLALVEDDDSHLNKCEKEAALAQTVIVFVGTGPEWESEGFDRVGNDLPRRQNDLITRVATACTGRTIVVVNTGSPVNMTSWIGDVDAVIQVWFPGMGFAMGLLDLLVGDCSPCARLPTTFWSSVEDCPAGHVGSLMESDKKIVYKEGIYVGYRQPPSRLPAPCFAFGHGLSYTNFAYSIAGSHWISTGLDAPLTIQVAIRNVGPFAGSETVLLFLQALCPNVQRPLVELKSFKKTSVLHPGESQTVELALERQSFAYWNTEERAWCVENGPYQVLFAGPRGVGDWRCVGELIVSVAHDLAWTN